MRDEGFELTLGEGKEEIVSQRVKLLVSVDVLVSSLVKA